MSLKRRNFNTVRTATHLAVMQLSYIKPGNHKEAS